LYRKNFNLLWVESGLKHPRNTIQDVETIFYRIKGEKYEI
jgi:hypothetical protein